MNKKKLPKAVTRTASDMRAADAAIDPAEPLAPRALPEIPPETTRSMVESTIVDRSPNIVSGATSVTAPLAPAAVVPVNAVIARATDRSPRRRRAEATVERYANFSALGGIIPLPVVNFASVTAIIVRMVKTLSRLYGVPFEHDRARAIVLGLIGGLMPTAASTIAASTLLYVIPGSNLVGLAVSSFTASACARKIGAAFIAHFESGASLADFPSFGNH